MSNETFYIKQGDTRPALDELLFNADGTALDLSAAGTAVTFHLCNRDGTVLINRSAAIVDGPTGHVRYTWQTGDTAVAGTFFREWQVTFQDATVVSVPNDRLGSPVVVAEQIA